MADSEVETPRLSPLAGPEARLEFVRELKALVDAGSYFIDPEDIARAILAQMVPKSLPE
jgi:anti-sigma28 factor (negative regulator of flagellin synthesis)